DDGNRLWLLDWEYAVIGDPCFDLASVCCYHDFNQQQRMSLLSQYLQLFNQEHISRLNRMCWLFDYIKELWFAARSSSIAEEKSL
ncbi:MAG: phosphotransferase, partial [Steroidobacter sp.]